MYTMVLMMAVTGAGEAPAAGPFGGCTGFVAPASCTGCTGSNFLGLRPILPLFPKSCTGCTGNVAPASCTGCTGTVAVVPAPTSCTGCTGTVTSCTGCTGSGFLGVRTFLSSFRSGCTGTVYSGCTGTVHTGCVGTVTPAPVSMPPATTTPKKDEPKKDEPKK